MGAEYSNTAEFRGATFHDADLSGIVIRECDLTGATIVSSALGGLRLSGYDGEIFEVFVDGVEVSGFVAAQLDARHPERVQLRAAHTAAELRAMWDTVERLWTDTRARAEKLPEPLLHERVEQEWSFVETMRHLLMATDGWVGRLMLGDPSAYHRFGLPPTDLSPEGSAELGLDLDARPTYAEVLALHLDRLARARRFVASVTDAQLDEPRTAVIAPDWGERTETLRECLRVLMKEYCAHSRFATRDLAVLEAR
jgi:uncharacterized damage-inducible protein DinB